MTNDRSRAAAPLDSHEARPPGYFAPWSELGPFERCPVCSDTVAVRMDVSWLIGASAEALGAIPIVGCGAPWHYVNRAALR